MSEQRSFHDATVALKPNQHSKPSTIWAAVLKLEKRADGPKTEEDYLWIKCHAKIIVKTIHDQYAKRFPSDMDFALKIGNKVADGAMTMGELDTYNDRVIAFEAVRISELPSRIAVERQPLQPSNHQVPQTTPLANTEDPFLSGSKALLVPSLSSPLIKEGPQDENAMPVPQYGQYQDHNLEPKIPPIQGRMQTPRPDIRFPPGPTAPSFTNGLVQDRITNPGLGNMATYEASRVPQSLSPSAGHSAFDSKSQRDIEASENNLAAPKLKHSPPDRLPIEGFPVYSAEADLLKQQFFQLQVLLKDAPPETLERGVEQGVKLLEDLRAPLLDKVEASPDAAQWIQQIDTLRKQAVKTKTIIGVVGNTGAGKSSVINAMLDEERLVPTNCMRACTAVVTEISYNHGDIPYQAQVEFITPADWEKELKTLFEDLLDGDGKVSRDCSNQDTDAGIAYAKIKAVYPKKTKEDIANSSIQKMLQDVSHILGKSKSIEETDSLRFYKRLQHFVDSKEKSTGDKDKDKKKEPREMEFWPLIRVVKIYVKSPALSTGAVIVDLPGVHDANAARAAVAESYMKQCTGLWIVAPINRAVDDKAAKSLLGESFKRQLKLDGGFGLVTFICSKTDDISLMEAQESLDLNDQMGPSWEEVDALTKKRKTLSKELDALKDSKAVYSEVMDDADEQIDVWEGIKADLEAGKTVFAPPAESPNKKRKRSESLKPRKKQRRPNASDEEDIDEDYQDDDSRDNDSEEEVPAEHSQGEPLNEEQVATKLADLRSTKKESRRQRTELENKIKNIRAEISEAEKTEKKIQADMAALCIAGRNQYSKGAIQQDYAAGIKELDQELAAEEDEENFNPENEMRDYDEVAHNLPVFCVSSRGYQKLQGRLRKDPTVPGFKTIEETEIPQLQAHCQKLTEAGRTESCKRFLNNVSQLLNSLSLWASSDGTGANMTPEQRAREAKFLEGGFKKLESGLDKVVAKTCKELAEEFKDNIFEKYAMAVSNAANEASNTAYKWGMKVNRDDRAAGGLCWSTYKAICRRNGSYVNAQGPHEWNHQLIEPMMKTLSAGWEKTFTRRSPAVMAGFAREAAKVLKDFHRDIDNRARKVGAGIAGLSMLQQQIQVYENILKDVSNTAKEMVNNTQKDINREFTPVVEQAMLWAYEACTQERGTGSYARMKAALNGHVEQQRHVMFQRSADEVRNLLLKMVKNLQEILDEKADEVFLAMRRDYRSVLGGNDLPQGEILPKAERLMRKAIMDKIDKVEKIFRRVAGLEADEDEEEGVPTDDLEPDTKDQKRRISPSPHLSPFGPQNVSATGTHTAETQHLAVKDEPMADALSAMSKVKVEADDSATTDQTSNALPEVLAVVKPAVTERSNTPVSAIPTASSSNTPSLISHEKQEDREATPNASVDHEFPDGPKREQHSDAEDADYDDGHASSSSEREPWQSKYRDAERSDSE